MEQKEAKRIAKDMTKITAKGRKGRKARARLTNRALTELVMRLDKSNHPQWYLRLGGNLVNLNYGMKDSLGRRNDLLIGMGGESVGIRTVTDALMPIVLTAGSGDATRIAAEKIANELRLVSGSNTIYDVDDIIDYLLNARSIWAGLLSLRRALRTLNAKDPYDMDAWVKYLKMALGQTQLLPPTEDSSAIFRREAANTVNWLNTMMKAVRYMIPSRLDVITRTSWMFDNIFVDSVGKKFGAKMMVLKNLPQWSHSGTSHSAISKPFYFGNTHADAIQSIEDLVLDFTGKPVNIAIAGDLMKAYGMASFVDLGQVGYDELPNFIYDTTALHQLQNATPLFMVASTITNAYAPGQDPVTVVPLSSSQYSTAATIIQPAFWRSKMVNTDDNHVEAGETLSLTRLQVRAVAESASGNVTSVKVKSVGTELPLDYLYLNDLSDPNNYNALICLNAFDVSAGTGASMEAAVAAWTKDDYGPMVVQAATSGTPGSTDWQAFALFDFENWAVVSSPDLDALHTTAIMSLLTPAASLTMQTVAKL